MLGFLNPDKSRTKVIDKIWMTTAEKLQACRGMLELNSNCLFAVWFEETRQELEKLLGGGSHVYLAYDLLPSLVASKMLVFAEHHPSRAKEESIFAKLALHEVPVLSGLDEPLLLYFGGEKVMGLMKRLGMKEGESIGNSLVSKSIRNAQRKIDDKVTMERPARSASEWFRLNLPVSRV